MEENMTTNNYDVIDEICGICESLGFSKDEVFVIGCLSGSTDARQKYGSTRASYLKTLEILSQYKTFEEVLTEIEKGIGFDYIQDDIG